MFHQTQLILEKEPEKEVINIKYSKDMKNQALKFEDFENEKLSKNQQKTVHGGDGGGEPIDPGKGNGKGNG